jgi:putative spermidine/putrescine transport system permease protein
VTSIAAAGPKPARPHAALGEGAWLMLLIAPASAVFAAFWLLPMAQLIVLGGEGEEGFELYLKVLATGRYLSSLAVTVAVAASVTVLTLVISLVSGLFLQRNRFPGRGTLVAMLTLPLAFPGVVIGFMVIMLAGRQGLIGDLAQRLTGSKLVFAYSMAGLFMGYVYFSIPRVILTVMAAAEKLDPRLEEAARSLGAGRWRVVADVILPGLQAAIISSGAICFATSMGAFGTAFTLGAGIDVLPLVIYTEFTLHANIATAAALSVLLGVITWAILALARSAAGSGVAAAA